MFYEIGIVGTGNVAHVLASALKDGGHNIAVVYGRNAQKAENLATAVRAEHATTVLDFAVHTCDILMLCVRDSAIHEVSTQIRLPRKCLWCHVSGSVPMNVLAKHRPCGVFYPVQTFVEGITTPMEDVPIYIEGSDEQSVTTLAQLAASLCAIPREASSSQRMHVHLCAVMASNFCHHILRCCRQQANRQSLFFKDLHPLMTRTLQNVFTHEHKNTQTGPALRGDQETIRKHLALLQDTPHTREMYQVLSEGIKQASATDPAFRDG